MSVIAVAWTALFLSFASASPVWAQRSSSFDGWNAVIIAGDWTDSEGAPIDAFDNARRDLALAFQNAGFDPALMTARSLRPDRPDSVTALAAAQEASERSRQASRGCLVYITSHGLPGEIVFGPSDRLQPDRMNALLSDWCGARPTVAVVSACYSGSFMGALARPNRMVVTAARADRSSFGCGAEAAYPYFDACVIEEIRTASNFIDLANQARACVTSRESAEGLAPPSEPQVRIGAEMQLLLPMLRFDRAAPN